MLLLLALGGLARADEADKLPSEEVKLGGDEKKLCFRLGPLPEAKEPKKGFGLLVILPGGDGSAEFNMFCRRILIHGAGGDYVGLQLVAPKWTETQPIVWPTAKNRVEGMKFTTEEFVEEAIADARKWKKIDPARILVLAWSSSGPAAYALSLAKDATPVGYFIAMSVFKPAELGDLAGARGLAYFLYHSAEDRVCPFRMAEEAEKKLSKEKAKVNLQKYTGGHGWHGDMYGDMRAGIAWLEENHRKAKRPPGRAG